MKQIIRVAIALTVAALATLGMAGAASAQSYTGAVVTASATSVEPGGQMTVSGENFLPDASVSVIVASTPTEVGPTMTDGDGNWSITFAAPTEPGAHTVTATDGVNTVVINFEVAGAATAVGSTSGALPYTGGDSLPMAQIGAGLLAAGAVIMLTVRKRNTLAHAKVDA